MNIQTERLENHTARLTVAVDAQQWEDAKEESARQLSKRYKIPGFRKGKAPYRIIEKYLGEAPIIEDAMERLGNQVYRVALEQSDVKPYTSGSLEDFQVEPQPTYIFTVPLEPEVTLGDYRAVRVDYEEPIITDAEVDAELRQLQQREALVEESYQPVAIGNRVNIDIHSVFVDGEEPAEDEAEPEADADSVPKKGDQFAHGHEVDVTLDPDDEPLLPGFIAALVGANVGDEVEFELTVPQDDDDYENIAGRKIQFSVIINAIQTVTLPALTDEFANRFADEYLDEFPSAEATGADAPTLTLLELRIKVREQLQRQAIAELQTRYSDEVLAAIIAGATVVYPDAMVDDRVHEMLHDLDNMLRRRQNMDLETYQKLTGLTHEDLHRQYEPNARESLVRSLVLGEVMVTEGIRVDAADVNQEVERNLALFGEGTDAIRQYFNSPQQRESIANSILSRRLIERLVQIGKGELPPTEAAAVAEADEQAKSADDGVAVAAEDNPTDQEAETDS